MVKIFTTFTGIGSPEIALENIGVEHEVVGLSEVDRYALLAYNAIHNDNEQLEEYPSKEEMIEYFNNINIAYNFSTGKSEIPRGINDIKKLYSASVLNNNYGDICKLDPHKLPYFDMLTYTFPCKNISIAGNREGFSKDSGTQSSLVWEVQKIVEAKKPKVLMMENVSAIIDKNNIDGFKEWIDYLDEIGYNSYYKLLNASGFQLAQNRKRVIMISIRKDVEYDFEFPVAREGFKVIDDILECNVDKKFYINKEFSFTDKFGDWDIQNKLVPVAYIDKKGMRSNKVVVAKNGLCPTLTAMQGGNRQPKILDNTTYEDIFQKDGYCIRKLTPLECWRLQGYSDEHFGKAKQDGGLSNSKLYERAGRGIPVTMLEDVFNGMRSLLDCFGKDNYENI